MRRNRVKVLAALAAGALALGGCASQARPAGTMPVVEVSAPRVAVVSEVVAVAEGPRLVLPVVEVTAPRGALDPALAGSPAAGFLVN
ncbi:MAG: hypothetical protein R6X12_00590 [bacterium]